MLYTLNLFIFHQTGIFVFYSDNVAQNPKFLTNNQHDSGKRRVLIRNINTLLQGNTIITVNFLCVIRWMVVHLTGNMNAHGNHWKCTTGDNTEWRKLKTATMRVTR